jgi:signal transduction histidine kinase/ligand-binding sensor domain-containing protein
LSAFNIFPKFGSLRLSILLIVLLCLFDTGYALDGSRDPSQYLRREWGSRQVFDGAPISALAQTPDGYLWLGTSKGLYRFDGEAFEEMHPPDSSMRPITNVLEFVVDAQGDLWMWLQDASLFRYRNNTFTLVVASTQLIGNATAIAPSNDGGVLVATLGGGMLEFHGDIRHQLPGQPKGFVAALAQSKDGKIWLGTHDEGLYFSANGSVHPIKSALLDTKINCLLSASSGKLWIGTDDGLASWDGEQITMPNTVLRHSQVLGLLEDHDKNIWVTTQSNILRVNPAGDVQIIKEEKESNTPATVLEDREGSIWIGDTQGLVQLRDGIFTGYLPSHTLLGDREDSIFVDEEETLWSAPASGGLLSLRDGRTRKLLAAGLGNDVVYSIDGAGHELWLGRQRGGLTHLHLESGGMKEETFTTANGLAQNTVYSVKLARDGSVWAGSLTAGISHLKDGVIRTYTSADGPGSDNVSAIEEGVAGTMWFGTSRGLSSLSGNRWHTYGTADGLPSNEVLSLFRDREGVLWVGTRGGLAAWFDGAFHRAEASSHRAQLNEPILGIAEDKQGTLWVATNAHVFSLSRTRLARDMLDSGQLRDFGSDDGLPTSEGVQRCRSVVADHLGKIWFSLSRGISAVDPSGDALTSPPTIARVTSVAVDGHTMPGGQVIKISAAHHRVVFHYTGMSLALPERVRFRYRLTGFDPGWSDVETAPEAVYTNLGPGSYSFELEAFNDLARKTWSTTSVALNIKPTLWQTWPFRSACVLAALLSAAALYRFRMQHLLQQANVRFEERLAERARIARDLHDTLLQGFLSASMQLHVAAEQVSPDSPAKPLLARILQLMRQVTEEGRNALKGLRSSEASDQSLEAAFSRMPQTLGAPASHYRVVVEGTSRALRPVIHDEIRQIGQEALVNAGRHARAGNIEVVIYYSPGSFAVTVRDDGCGIEPGVLREGRPGHWGLPGMRERAERIGAKLQLFSSKLSGTEVRVTVPGRIAYEQQTESGVLLFFRRALLIPRPSAYPKSRKRL